MAPYDLFLQSLNYYRPMDARDELRFTEAIVPLVKEDFFKKRVLDAACGAGRNSFWAVRWGAREVVSFDRDPEVLEFAQLLLKNFGNTKVLKGDLYEMTWEKPFDLVFAIDMLEHMPDAHGAVSSLLRALSARGVMLVRVPQRERQSLFSRLLISLRLSKKRYFSEEQLRALFPGDIFSEVHVISSARNRKWTVIALKKQSTSR